MMQFDSVVHACNIAVAQINLKKLINKVSVLAVHIPKCKKESDRVKLQLLSVAYVVLSTELLSVINEEIKELNESL